MPYLWVQLSTVRNVYKIICFKWANPLECIKVYIECYGQDISTEKRNIIKKHYTTSANQHFSTY